MARKVKLLVIDSFAFHFRYPMVNEPGFDTSVMQSLGQKLHTLAHSLQMAVIVVNQMTTKIDLDSELSPALGESWSHVPSVSLKLSFHNSNHSQIIRCFKVVKSPLSLNKQVHFVITQDGVRDFVA